LVAKASFSAASRCSSCRSIEARIFRVKWSLPFSAANSARNSSVVFGLLGGTRRASAARW
jgi:hypothetical protein